MAQDGQGIVGAQPQPLPRYRVEQLHSRRLGNESVSDFESLVTHHPIANERARIEDGIPVQVENPRTRSYGVIGGELQELETRRTDGGARSVLGVDQVLLTKDFILEDSRIARGGARVREVDVPSPVAGYVNRVDAAGMGAVDIYDREGGVLVARVLHLDPISVTQGATIAYGQALGVQDRQGLPATAGIHVHMEVDTRYYRQYENYIEDLVSGRLSIDPARRGAGIEAREVIDDGTIRIGESSDLVRRVQQHLNVEGFRGADGQPLAEDGVYRLSMQAAVLNFQQARGLPQSGDIDHDTLQLIAPRVFPPAQHEERGQHNGRPPYLDRFGAEPRSDGGDDPLLQQAQDAVRRLDASLGRGYDGASACMAASLACLARDSGLTRIDHVVLSRDSDSRSVRAGERVFVVQGALDDPAHLRAHMRTDEAVRAPAAESLQRLEVLQLSSERTLAPQQDASVQQREQHEAMRRSLV